MRWPLPLLVLPLLVLLAGCGRPTGPALVSAQSPPGTGMVNDNSEPQPPGSLPPGAANPGPGVGATQPSYLNLRLGR